MNSSIQNKLKKRSEAEIRFEQDKKNYQDFVYQTNQSIQNLQFSLNALVSKQENLANLLVSNQTSVKGDFYKLEESVVFNLKECKSTVNDVISQFNSLLDNFRKICLSIQESKKEQENHYQLIQSLQSHMINLSLSVERLKKDSEASVNVLQGKFTSDLSRLKVDLTPKIPEIDPVETAITKRLDPVSVDMAGLVREIALLKKAQAYDEKKFEQIYTLIERLKEGK